MVVSFTIGSPELVLLPLSEFGVTPGVKSAVGIGLYAGAEVCAKLEGTYTKRYVIVGGGQ